MDGFNLSTVTPAEDREDAGVTVHVRDARGESMFYGDDKKPVTILVAGTYSKLYRKVTSAIRDRALKQRRATLTADILFEQQLETVASCILAWDGFFDGDASFPLTKANAMRLLSMAPWIREDVEVAMQDHESFFENSSNS